MLTIGFSLTSSIAFLRMIIKTRKGCNQKIDNDYQNHYHIFFRLISDKYLDSLSRSHLSDMVSLIVASASPPPDIY